MAAADLTEFGQEARQSERPALAFAQDVAVRLDPLRDFQSDLHLALPNFAAIIELKRQMLQIEGVHLVAQPLLQCGGEKLSTQLCYFARYLSRAAVVRAFPDSGQRLESSTARLKLHEFPSELLAILKLSHFELKRVG